MVAVIFCGSEASMGENSVDCLGAHLLFQLFALLGAGWRGHIDFVLSPCVVQHLLAHLIGEGGVVGHDCDVLSGIGLVVHVVAEGQQRGDQEEAGRWWRF